MNGHTNGTSNGNLHIANLVQAFEACGYHDNKVRKAGEEALKNFAKDPSYVEQLVSISTYDRTNPQVCQMALTELRKRALKPTLTAKTRLHIRQGMQHILGSSGEDVIHRAACDTLAATAKLALTNQEWPDFLPWIGSLSGSQEASSRKHATKLLGLLLAYLGSEMTGHFKEVIQICKNGLIDQDVGVQREAFTALGQAISNIPDETLSKPVIEILPVLFQALQNAVSRKDTETVMEAFTTVTELAEAPIQIPTEYLPQLIKWLMVIAANGDQELCLRQQSLQVIEALGNMKPKQFVKTGLVKEVVLMLCSMTAEPLGEDEDEEDDTNELPAPRIASQTLDSLAQVLPSSHIFPEALNYARNNITSSNELQRKSACDVLTVVIEGCSKPTRKSLALTLEVLSGAMQDQNWRVRSSALAALSQLAEYCQPEITKYTAQILPGVFQLLKDSSDIVQDQACYCLQAVCENLEGDQRISDYVEGLMSSLGEILHNGRPTIRTAALKAIACTAQASGKNFGNFIPQLLPILHQFMQIKEGDMLECRAAATECLGSLYDAIGFEGLRPTHNETMVLVFEGFSLGENELREYCHITLSHIASASKFEFAPWLPKAVGFAIESLSADDGGVKQENGENRHQNSPGSVDLASQDTEESEEEEEARLKIHSAVLEEKASAMHALGVYAQECPEAFRPFIKDSLHLTLKMAEYFHEAVRDEAYTALAQILKATLHNFPPASNGSPSEEVKLVSGESVQILIAAVEDDDSADAVSSALISMADFVDTGACNEVLDRISDCATRILSGTAICQEVQSDFEEWEDADIKENNSSEMLIEAVCDLLPALVRKGGKQYAKIWNDNHWRLVQNCMKPKKPSGVRSAALALVAEVVKESLESTQDLHRMLDIIRRELHCEEDSNKQHAAFCLGIIAQHKPQIFLSNPSCTQLQLHFFKALQGLLSNEEAPTVHDNALGAIARILTFLPTEQIPIEQIVTTLLAGLPLKEDFEEAEPVYTCLLKMLDSPGLRGRVNSSLPGIVQALQAAVHQETIPIAQRQQLSSAMQPLNINQ